ncbi:MAG: hypothetical protein SPI77_06050 [Corynebacterium sp.]|nr:hypothetical protein [Corynebacterium sp.]
MRTITFDVYMPDRAVEPMCEMLAFGLGQAGIAVGSGDGVLSHVAHPRIEASIADQLKETFEADHDGKELEDPAVHRFVINLADTGYSGSINQLIMRLSRVFTPQANLPKDPAALMNEEAFEVASIYPWTVAVL